MTVIALYPVLWEDLVVGQFEILAGIERVRELPAARRKSGHVGHQAKVSGVVNCPVIFTRDDEGRAAPRPPPPLCLIERSQPLLRIAAIGAKPLFPVLPPQHADGGHSRQLNA